MNSKQIDCVLELALTQNFNRAAVNLNLTQPTLSYHINAVERELGFTIFTRNPRGAALTPAGAQFCETLRGLRGEFRRAVEQGQNFSRRYRDNLTVGLPMRSALYFLPEAIAAFEREHEGIAVTPEFIPLHSTDRFFFGGQDLVFAREQDLLGRPQIRIHPLFKSRFYVVTLKDDPLAQQSLIRAADLKGRTLMVGGGSQPELRAVQQRLLQELHLDHFNSPDPDSTFTSIAAGKGICIAPGFLNGHTGEFAWTPFDCEECVSCVLAAHAGERRTYVGSFIETLTGLYAAHPDFPC